MRSNEWTRRRFLESFAVGWGLSAVSTGGAESAACGDAFAGRTIRWIVPQPPGGGYDAYSRLIAPFFARTLDANVVVENIVGAGGGVGLAALRDASPDGTVIGVMNAPGMVVASAFQAASAPDPVNDFANLGRFAETPQVWAAATSSGLRTIDDVLSEAGRRRVIIGIQDVESTNFAGFTVGADLLQIDSELVVGYRGTAAASMAALRGEVDLVGFTFHSLRKWIDAGDLVPVLQLTESAIGSHPSLDGVAVLGGENGLAVRRARELGRNPERAREDARALVSVMSLGRVVVAPATLEPPVLECLEAALYETLTGADLTAAAARANLPIGPERGLASATRLRQGRDDVERFLPSLREAIRRARG